MLPVLQQNVFSQSDLNEQFICCKFHTAAEDQSGAAFDTHTEGQMHWCCGVVSLLVAPRH